MRLLTRLNNGIARIEGIFLSVFLLVMIFLAFLQVVMRDVFDAGIPWADTVVRQMVLWVGFLGAALATKLNQNLTLEVLTKFMPERIRHLTAVFVKIFAAIVTLMLLEASLRFMADERSTGQQFLHLFPSWWSLSIIPAAFVLIPFHLFVSLLTDIGYFAKGSKKGTE